MSSNTVCSAIIGLSDWNTYVRYIVRFCFFSFSRQFSSLCPPLELINTRNNSARLASAVVTATRDPRFATSPRRPLRDSIGSDGEHRLNNCHPQRDLKEAMAASKCYNNTESTNKRQLRQPSHLTSQHQQRLPTDNGRREPGPFSQQQSNTLLRIIDGSFKAHSASA